MRRSRQVIRLLGLLKALQDGERLHVAQLAARFHVRRETVYRDLRALGELEFRDRVRLTPLPPLTV